jgi:integrase
MRKQTPFILLLCFIVFFVFYYKLTILESEIFSTFLSVTTFLFAIFAGFFISRQGNRYSAMRDAIAYFDGEASDIYRQADLLPKKQKELIKALVKNEYQRIISEVDWEVAFMEKTRFMSDIMAVLASMQRQKPHPVMATALNRITQSIRAMQTLRKRIIALGKERIPIVQWALIVSLAVIIITLIASIHFHLIIFTTLIKALFSTVVVLVLIMLFQFDQLKFYEDEIGLTTAQDVMDIIKGKK